jgi:hypothetical protein
MGGEKSASGARYSRGSEEEFEDFSHQGLDGKLLETGQLKKFSTFPQGLLLLLVL